VHHVLPSNPLPPLLIARTSSHHAYAALNRLPHRAFSHNLRLPHRPIPSMTVAPNPRCRLLHRKRLFHRHRRLRLVLTRVWMAPAPLSSKCAVDTKLPCLTARSPAPPRSQVLRSSRSAIPRPRPITRSPWPRIPPPPYPRPRPRLILPCPRTASNA
jgi:hypothetical protein